MSIQRMFNSLWAVITTGGMVQKIATNPYVPNPGAGDPTANNQALAAVTAGSPFITINSNGLAVNANGNPSTGSAAASTSLGAFSSGAGIALDENSGKYQVVRQYGDIYLYNDGNIISWGGNGKNFSFGNGYEEAHAWANGAYVYNSETFTIPKGAFSPYLTQSTPVPSGAAMPASLDDYEWLGGNVSKSWGVDYTFSYGTAYEWSAGPNDYIDAYGNTHEALKDVKQGKHCTYSYGTGYEEALIAWDKGCTWFHADDTTSPYYNRVHDDWKSPYLQLETVASSFAQSAGDQAANSFVSSLVGGNAGEEAVDSLSEGQAAADAVFNPQDFASRNTWLVQNLLVSKTFGNTYEYHNGPGLSIQEGPSEERKYGNTSSTTIGNSTESTTGNKIETTTGNKTETTTGNSTEMVQGNSLEQFWGGKAEFFMGGKSEMSLGAADEINLAAKVEIVGGAATEIFMGLKLELTLGASVENKLGAHVDLSETVDVDALNLKVQALEAGQATLANFAMTAADVVCNL